MSGKKIALGFCLMISTAFAQAGGRVEIGDRQTVLVSFIRAAGGGWGMEVTSDDVPALIQLKPVQIEVCKSEEIVEELTAGYHTVKKSASGIEAYAEIHDGEAVFHIHDLWQLHGDILSAQRKVEIDGSAPGGFNSSVTFHIDPAVRWSDMNCLIPGALYGDPANNGDFSPGGMRNYKARRFILREDMLTAPLFALSFYNGSSVTMMDPAPRGESTVEETKLTKNVMTDERFQFGALRVWQEDNLPIEFGFQYPGSLGRLPFGPNASSDLRWFRRYHPITQGIAHNYQVDFRFGNEESFRDVTRNSWRWAWNTLKPAVKPIDVEQMRRVLTDHLAAQAATIDGRTGIPFAVATFDTNAMQWNWTMSAMGFVSKNLECADQLLREGDRDPGERGQKMRAIGLSIINSMVQALHEVPLQGTGYDLATGKPWTGEHQEWLAPWLRNATEGMRVVMRAYQREKGFGRLHPEWLQWIQTYVDWLLLQQREDGSFPRRWEVGSNVIAEETGSMSNAPVPLLVLLTEETGDPKYFNAAVRAAEYIWENFGKQGFYAGGASDNPNITDKEAGMLSLEAFLSLYESTKETKWLERAMAAGDYTETWIWIWNLPMPLDATDAQLHWKKGVPTIGLQGITARGPGGADEYLDWSASSYARLYKYTDDLHYLDVARILLHATKSMVALPGRQYDMRGIGWQQEHWSMGPGRWGRGVGGHRFWLPWVSANHLYSITGLEEVDPVLFQQLSGE